MYLAAFDPGKTTGYVVVRAFEYSIINMGEVFTATELWELLYKWRPKVVIYEKFIYRGGVHADLSGCRLEGLFDLWGDLEGKVIAQKSTVKTFWTREKCQAMGFDSTSKHTRDAIKHLLQYCVFDAKLITLEKLK